MYADEDYAAWRERKPCAVCRGEAPARCPRCLGTGTDPDPNVTYTDDGAPRARERGAPATGASP